MNSINRMIRFYVISLFLLGSQIEGRFILAQSLGYPLSNSDCVSNVNTFRAASHYAFPNAIPFTQSPIPSPIAIQGFAWGLPQSVRIQTWPPSIAHQPINRLEVSERKISQAFADAQRAGQLEQELELSRAELAEAKQLLGIIQQELEQTQTETARLKDLETEFQALQAANQKLSEKLLKIEKNATTEPKSLEDPATDSSSGGWLQEKIELLEAKMKTLEEATVEKLERAERRIRNRMGRQREKLVEEGVDQNDKKIQDIDRKMKLELNNSFRRIKAEEDSKMLQLKNELKALKDSKNKLKK